MSQKVVNKLCSPDLAAARVTLAGWVGGHWRAERSLPPGNAWLAVTLVSGHHAGRTLFLFAPQGSRGFINGFLIGFGKRRFRNSLTLHGVHGMFIFLGRAVETVRQGVNTRLVSPPLQMLSAWQFPFTLVMNTHRARARGGRWGRGVLAPHAACVRVPPCAPSCVPPCVFACVPTRACNTSW